MNRRIKLIGLSALVLVTAALIFWALKPEPAKFSPTLTSRPHGAPMGEAPDVAAPTTAIDKLSSAIESAGHADATPSSAGEVSAAVAPVSPPAAATVAEGLSISEQEGARRMIAAHVSLRSRSVADPDSAANRAILHSMISKALSRPDTPAVPSAR